jgi:secondary thiamine-phosphate synthase enzyme
MTVHHDTHTLDTRGDGEVIDVTDLAEKAIANSGVREGIVTVFVAHSTCGVTIIEAEPGCNADLNTVMERLAPEADRWEHNERNADTNGHSHARAGIIGPSVTVPVTTAEMMLGVWQRIVCVDFDDRTRSRRLVVTVVGD